MAAVKVHVDDLTSSRSHLFTLSHTYSYKVLLEAGADPLLDDRWGDTACEDARCVGVVLGCNYYQLVSKGLIVACHCPLKPLPILHNYHFNKKTGASLPTLSWSCWSPS